MANNKNSKFNEIRNDLFCKYCGKQLKNINSLKQHECRCKLNTDRIPIKSGFKIAMDNGWDPSWNRGLTKKTDDRVKKNSINIKKHFEENGSWWSDKHHSVKAKEKIRVGTLKYLQNIKGGIDVRYNKDACKYINNLNEKFNWNLQHAENGGEVCICGYFLDGYDKDLNIAFEYDEKRHYIDVNNNVLRNSDIERMHIIKEKLNCKFYRYNEVLDLFYEA